MEAEFIINPKTKKVIKIGGKTYLQLLAEGVTFETPQRYHSRVGFETDLW